MLIHHLSNVQNGVTIRKHEEGTEENLSKKLRNVQIN